MAETAKDLTAPFLRACRRQPVPYTPVWFMRQAGRYMTEYRAIRAKYTLLEICSQPDLAAEVTLQPVRALGVDAAILFADILLPLPAMGAGLTFADGEGPVISNPISTLADVALLRPLEPDPLPNVSATLRLVRQELAGRVPLIGFAGGPFTLASYLIEGGASRDYRRTKQLMYGAPETWHALMSHLATATTVYLQAQIRAGAEAVQLFDSWIG
ncbi:MAG: uroporphyrinogen decarboxylase family protein, partial [Chloroflexota bacterium]|nr:uroporphyrinogen decarboxylase family protein [Chloroflexota bacterium]